MCGTKLKITCSYCFRIKRIRNDNSRLALSLIHFSGHRQYRKDKQHRLYFIKIVEQMTMLIIIISHRFYIASTLLLFL